VEDRGIGIKPNANGVKMEGVADTEQKPIVAAVEVRDALKARLSCARQDLEGVLKRLDDSDLLWSPREGMRTIANQLLEIANKEKETLGWTQTGVWPDDDPDAFDLDTATLEEIKAVMEALRVETYRYIDSLSDAELEQPVPNPDRWIEALRIANCPLSEVLRNIATHEWYHTGQLITYLWMRGDNPYDW
jgi:uncharacterized damage-inducible protein DinB